jgi:hypothetical protein
LPDAFARADGVIQSNVCLNFTIAAASLSTARQLPFTVKQSASPPTSRNFVRTLSAPLAQAWR